MSNHIETFTISGPTVICMVGPTMCGKSVLAQRIKTDLATQGVPVKILSSDTLRAELLNDPEAHKYDAQMMPVSEKAFKLLFAQMEAHGSWPYPTPVIIVDTTGLSKDFRSQVAHAAHRLGYRAAAIALNYKKMDDYMNVPGERVDRRLIKKHLERLRTDALPFLRQEFDQVIHVKQKTEAFSGYVFHYRNQLHYWLSDRHGSIDVIGDVHGCYDETVALLERLGHRIEDDRIIIVPGERDVRAIAFIGDLIDKGPRSKDVLRLVVNSMQVGGNVTGLWGNHENFVYNYFKGTPGYADVEPAVLEKFDCVTLKDDPEFCELLEQYRLRSYMSVSGIAFSITHAPCEDEWIGKSNRSALKLQQRRVGQPRREQFDNEDDFRKAVELFFSFIPRQAARNKPLHLFGHVAVAAPFKLQNKVGIDTGAVYGGRLTAARVNMADGWIVWHSVESKPYRPEPLIRLFDVERATNASTFSLDNLEPYDRRRVWGMAKQGVAFVSGTMSPAASDVEADDLESLDKAFAYYREHGIEELVIQPKWMGSRANIYLDPDISKCFAISRNGFKIKLDLDKEFKRLQPLLAAIGAEHLILDAELMPWSALGQGLIEETFGVVAKGVRTEIEALREYGFEDAFFDLHVAANTARHDMNHLSREDLIKQYGHAKASTFENLRGFNWIPLSQQEEMITAYDVQLGIHGVLADPKIMPFAILRSISKNGHGKEIAVTGRMMDAAFIYMILQKEVGEQDRSVHSLGEIGPARDLVEWTRQMGLEGVVVKPRYHKDGVAPYLKVRNPEYLRIVYGYDYTLPAKRDKLIKQKQTGGKVRTSIKEWELGLKLLEMPREQQVPENREYLALLAALVIEQANERALDPRL